MTTVSRLVISPQVDLPDPTEEQGGPDDQESPDATVEVNGHESS